jgi:hypothetical protein
MFVAPSRSFLCLFAIAIGLGAGGLPAQDRPPPAPVQPPVDAYAPGIIPPGAQPAPPASNGAAAVAAVYVDAFRLVDDAGQTLKTVRTRLDQMRRPTLVAMADGLSTQLAAMLRAAGDQKPVRLLRAKLDRFTEQWSLFAMRLRSMMDAPAWVEGEIARVGHDMETLDRVLAAAPGPAYDPAAVAGPIGMLDDLAKRMTADAQSLAPSEPGSDLILPGVLQIREVSKRLVRDLKQTAAYTTLVAGQRQLDETIDRLELAVPGNSPLHAAVRASLKEIDAASGELNKSLTLRPASVDAHQQRVGLANEVVNLADALAVRLNAELSVDGLPIANASADFAQSARTLALWLPNHPQADLADREVAQAMGAWRRLTNQLFHVERAWLPQTMEIADQLRSAVTSLQNSIANPR